MMIYWNKTLIAFLFQKLCQERQEFLGRQPCNPNTWMPKVIVLLSLWNSTLKMMLLYSTVPIHRGPGGYQIGGSAHKMDQTADKRVSLESRVQSNENLSFAWGNVSIMSPSGFYHCIWHQNSENYISVLKCPKVFQYFPLILVIDEVSRKYINTLSCCCLSHTKCCPP